MTGALRLVIDTDTASDDAVALLLATAAPEAVVEAVTVVAGNVPLPAAVRNALITLEFAGASDVPVYRGLDRPLLRPPETAEAVHGPGGMGGAVLAGPAKGCATEHAVDALLRLAGEHPGEFTLVTLGPLTNIAAALIRDRSLLTMFAHCYLMAGSPDGFGNVTATAEFNVWADPEAAAIVLSAPGDRTLVGWNVSRRYAVMGSADRQRLAALRTPQARFVSDINVAVEHFARTTIGLDGYDLPDPVTMAIALDPGIIRCAETLPVSVACGDELRGQLIVDRRVGSGHAAEPVAARDARESAPGPAPTPATISPPYSSPRLPQSSPTRSRVVWDIDEAAFKRRLFEACAAEGPRPR